MLQVWSQVSSPKLVGHLPPQPLPLSVSGAIAQAVSRWLAEGLMLV